MWLSGLSQRFCFSSRTSSGFFNGSTAWPSPPSVTSRSRSRTVSMREIASSVNSTPLDSAISSVKFNHSSESIPRSTCGLVSGVNGLADSVLSFVAVSRSSGHDKRHELSLFLKHADLAKGGLFRISILDVFGLNFLAALGLDQRRDTTQDVQLIVAIKVAHVAGAKPFIIGERLL